MNDFRGYLDEQRLDERPADAQSMDSDRMDIYAANDNPNQVVTHAPKERFRLGYFDVMCLVVNFMIGTGVFNSHQRVMQGTGSTGAALLLWAAGIVYCLCGIHVYIEYGLNVPRFTIDGVEQSVPRSGGDLNYLQYVYRKPAYRKNTIALSTCVFGICFIAFGNMAGNAISFSTRLLRATGVEDPSNAAVRGIAIFVATMTCFIHAFSRRGGILLNNIFAIVKISMLLIIVIVAIIVSAGGIKGVQDVMHENTKTDTAFEAEDTDANGYAHAFLAVIFSFWGFEQPNYILGEIRQPRRKFPIAMTAGTVLVAVLYMAVTLSYMVVVPKDEQINGEGGVAQRFFELTLGSVSSEETGQRVFNAFLAISSFGNMIVMTYTAARVKQEIAKEGILPFPKFFAQNTDLSLGRLLHWLRSKGYFANILRTRWFLPEHHSEKTPVGAFVLHFFSCLILIFATWKLSPDDAYNLLTTLSVYVINCFFGIWIGMGILILRFKGPPPTASSSNGDEQSLAPPTWRKMTGPRINPYLSVFCAGFFTICNAWPVITTWIAPRGRLQENLQWWLIPTIAWVLIFVGAAWFLGFLTVARRIERKSHKVFVVEKKPEFEKAEYGNDEKDGRSHGGLVLVHETTYLSWVGKEALDARGPEAAMFGEATHQQHNPTASPFAGTDFEGYFNDGPQKMDGHAVNRHAPPQPYPPQPVFQQHQTPTFNQQFSHSPNMQQQSQFPQYQQQYSASPHSQQFQQSHGQPSRGFSSSSFRQ